LVEWCAIEVVIKELTYRCFTYDWVLPFGLKVLGELPFGKLTIDQLVSNQASIIYLSSFSEIGMFDTVNSLVVISSTWLISLRKFDVF
jgi:hypothetical protein